jgi:hypothetical protein
MLDERRVQYMQIPTGNPLASRMQPKLKSERWEYQDIQQLWISPQKIVIVTYTDRGWLLGVDREFEFHLTGEGQSFNAAHGFLKGKLNRRFIAALADPKSDAALGGSKTARSAAWLRACSAGRRGKDCIQDGEEGFLAYLASRGHREYEHFGLVPIDDIRACQDALRQHEMLQLSAQAAA